MVIALDGVEHGVDDAAALTLDSEIKPNAWLVGNQRKVTAENARLQLHLVVRKVRLRIVERTIDRRAVVLDSN
jgi:hypothetical protein